MKTQSNIRPELYSIVQFGDIAEIAITDNLTETDGEYLYDEYHVTVPWRENLQGSISGNPAAWLQYARETEIKTLSDHAREERNRLLTECDWTQCADSPISEEQKAEWAQYRQALRDMPEQDGFPYTIVWPRKQQADGTVSAENYQD